MSLVEGVLKVGQIGTFQNCDIRDCSLFIVQGETEEKLYGYNIFLLPPS
jgi:hypothetical protein